MYNATVIFEDLKQRQIIRFTPSCKYFYIHI